MTDHHIGTSPSLKGMNRTSIDLIGHMFDIVDKAQPINGRGVGYKLFTAGLIPSMATAPMKVVYRLLKEARERGVIPWDWIVDETRELEQGSSWSNPEQFLQCARQSYQRDLWQDQPRRVEVWSEKGTIRGVLGPVLEDLGVGFRVLHGFSGAGTVHEVANDFDARPLVALYAGDWDPSGLCMSERDLPARLVKYGGDHVTLKRIALLPQDLPGLPSFPASQKKKDSRYNWFVENYGTQCWEIDALDPVVLRERVRSAIIELIEPGAWDRGILCNKAEQESLRIFFDGWQGAA